MRRIVLAALLALVALAAAPGAPASAKMLSTALKVAPNYWCANPMDGETCATEFTANLGGMWVNEATTGTAHVHSLSTGETVVLEFGSDVYVDRYGDPTTFDATAELASGRYEVTLVVDTPGEWSCSQYNPDGCTWLSGDHQRFDWRFVYSADATASYQQYAPPLTRVHDGSIKAPTKSKRVLRGLVASRLQKPDYTLTDWMPQANRAVRVQMKGASGWVTKATVRTGSGGRFAAIVRVARGSQHYWRVVIRRAGRSPGFTAYSAGRI